MSKHKSGPSTGHTPGPWKVTKSSRHMYAGASHTIEIDQENNDNADYIFIAKTPAHRVYKHGDEPRMEECLATARLIAAAPELLEALKEAYEILARERRWHESERVGNSTRGRLEDAIAKATGGVE